MKNIRASLRLLAAVTALPLFATAIAAQAVIARPLFNDTTTIPNMLYNGLRRLLGYKVVFNKASAPVVKGKPVWYVANHMSIADFIVLGSKLNGTFAGKGDISKWPVVAQVAQAIKFIAIRRSSQYNDESRGKIARNFNEGANTIMFPEGTTSDGKKVHLFRAALLTLLFGERAVDEKNNPVTLTQDVVVQPVAIRVTHINGKDAVGNDDLRNQYSMYDENHTLTRIFKRLQISSTTLELTVFPPLTPSDFSDAKELINKAAMDIAGVVNPGQTTFEKAEIPVKKQAKPS